MLHQEWPEGFITPASQVGQRRASLTIFYLLECTKGQDLKSAAWAWDMSDILQLRTLLQGPLSASGSGSSLLCL